MPHFNIFSKTFMYLMVLIQALICTHAQTYDNMTSLKRNLFSKYDKEVIPLANQSDVLNVTVVFSLMTISEVDTVNSLMKMRALLYLVWKDDKLTWSQSDYDGIDTLFLRTEEIWTPPLILGNGVPYEYVEKGWEMALVNNHGYVEVALGGSFDVLCAFTMIYWPFDRQACHIYFIPPYPGTKEKMNFIFPSKPIYDQDFIHMGEWTYETITVSYKNQFVSAGRDIIYTVKVRRQFAFYLLTVIIPLYCVCFLGLFVFLIPCESGERIGFAVTIMLSIVVFMMAIMDEVPKISDPLPYTCIYIAILVCIAFLVNIINIYSLNLYHRTEGQPIGQTQQNLVFFVSKFERKRSVIPDGSKNENKKEDHSSKSDSKELETGNGLSSASNKRDKSLEDEFLSEGSVRQERVMSWKDVSNSVDKITFFTVAPATILASLIGAIYFAATSDYPQWAK